MRKIYLLVASVFVGASVFGQTVTTTITSHFEGALTNPPQIGYYTWTPATDGYVSGNNTYGDKSVVQLFDANSGVTNSGTIDGVKVFIAHKANAGGSITVGVWENNNGNVGTLLGSQVFTLASVDTSQAAMQIIGTAPSIKGIYNVSATFTTPIAIPASKSFFAGVILPTTAAAGDTAVVLTTAGSFQSPNNATHAGVIESTDEFISYSDATQGQLKIGNAIFPTVTMSTVSVANVLKAQTRLYPNPANDIVNIEFGTSDVTAVTVLDLNGKVILNSAVNNGNVTLNVSDLEVGMYMYQAIDAEGNVLNTAKFSKK